MEKKKLFISQPMEGKTEEEIRKEREKALMSAKEILREEVEVIDSYIYEDQQNHTDNDLWCLGRSIMIMSVVDIVCFAKGWEEARGCKIEHECAVQYGKKLFELQ